MAPVTRKQYRNTAGHVIGVVTIDRRGDHDARALEPEEAIWLSEEERVATARAPRKPEDNPFANGDLTAVSDDERVTDATERPTDVDDAPASEPEDAPQEAPEAPPAASQAGPPPAATPSKPPQPAEGAPKPIGSKTAPSDADLAEAAAKESGGPKDEETGAVPQAAGEPPTGEFAQAEEVGTPGAVQQASLGGEAAKDLTPTATAAPARR